MGKMYTDFSIGAILGFITQQSPFEASEESSKKSSSQVAKEAQHNQDNNNHNKTIKNKVKRVRAKKYKCPYCWVALSNSGQFKGHLRTHTGERPFHCDQPDCGKQFTRNEELTRHKRIHSGLKPFLCDLCQKGFGRRDHLKKHLKTHDKRRDSAQLLNVDVSHVVKPQVQIQNNSPWNLSLSSSSTSSSSSPSSSSSSSLSSPQSINQSPLSLASHANFTKSNWRFYDRGHRWH